MCNKIKQPQKTGPTAGYWATAPIVALLTLVCCARQRQGLVVCMGEGVRVSVLATSRAGFKAPDGIAWHGGRVVLADEAGREIVAWQVGKGARTLTAASATLRSPEDVVVDEDGTIFFTDDDVGGLWRIGRHGELSRVAGPEEGLLSTEGVVIEPGGDLLVGDGERHTIFRVTRAGEVSVFLGPQAGIDKPESLAFDPEGNLYIADNRQNRVYRLDKKQCLTRLLTERDGLTHPESLCWQDGALYITDDEAGKFYRYTPGEGLQILAVFAGALKNLQGIAPGPAGSLLVTVQDLKKQLGLLLEIVPATEDSLAFK